MKYWKSEGRYQAEADALSALVPVMGECVTHKGEIWRAATKIYYDHFNNGFGNFWMEPAAFLMSQINLDDDIKQVLFEHANGRIADYDYDDEMDRMLDAVIEQLRDVDDRPNTIDMWEFTPSYVIKREFYDEPNEDEYY